MITTRRKMLRTMAAGIGTAAAAPIVPGFAKSTAQAGKPKRIIFFLQNQGFDPYTAIPKGLKEDAALDSFKFEEPIKDLEPIKDRLHIINGLHGQHTSPSHSAFFGALGGYRGGIGSPPRGATIDHVLSRNLPETILPHLCIGMDSLPNMRSRPTLATLSATGPGKPIFMHSNPQDLYQALFGSISTGEVRERYEARSNVLNSVEKIALQNSRGLPINEKERYSSYTDGFRDMNGLRSQLAGISDHLKKFAPVYGEKFTNPEFETDWHDSLLDLGISALKSGITNTLTIGSGRGEIFGAWKGLGVDKQGHNLGHMPQPNNEIWVKIRQYNCRMLVKMVKELESMPEGDGTMMDNTLIVYTSNNADKQHTSGANWPFILIGNPGGPLKTGRFTQMAKRPINDLYATLLHAVGAPVDRFNMEKSLAPTYHSKAGPIENLLA
ncbi:MAG: DUF1552 domain-containing protein [Verrucomicrobiales bacterium]|nr:DUF1552 domain-containing protein [Verrucomicrobiales bacterium]